MRAFFLFSLMCQFAFAGSVETYFIGPAINQAKSNIVVSLQTGETLRWINGSSAVGANSGAFSYTVSYSNSIYSYFGTTSLSEGTFLATGPCSITFTITSQQVATNAYAINVLRQVEATNSASFQIIPSTAVVIPSDSSGPVTIVLESSPDLVDWHSSMPGQYGASYTNRFFRVRAILSN